MSGVASRTIFISAMPKVLGQPKGEKIMKFSDFARVVTSVGSCWEPFTIHQIVGLSDGFPTEYDARDMMRQVDNIESVNPKNDGRMLGDPETGRALHRMDKWLRLNL